MLKELNHYENLGSPNFFWELFNQLAHSSKPWTVNNIQKYFYNRIIDSTTVFDGCLPLAQIIGVLKIDKNNIVTLESSIVEYLKTPRYLQNKLTERILLNFKNDEIFHKIFCSKNISYDIVYHSIQINNSAFLFKYSNLKHLLINFGFLYPHPDTHIHKFVIHSRYKIFFDKTIMPEIQKRKIGIEEFQKISEKKQIYGEIAENFTVNYEKKRLLGHNNIIGVQKISQYDVSAGYDIISFDSISSREQDRFIEVKSFVDVPSFYWSRNEIDASRLKKDKYYLYLIDRSHIADKDYIPTIIQNPFEKIILNNLDWDKRVEKYFISKK